MRECSTWYHKFTYMELELIESMAKDWSRVKPKLYTDISPIREVALETGKTVYWRLDFFAKAESYLLYHDVSQESASLLHVFELSGLLPVPNPILESHELHHISSLVTIPILVSLQPQTALNPSSLQLSCNEPCEPIKSFIFFQTNRIKTKPNWKIQILVSNFVFARPINVSSSGLSVFSNKFCVQRIEVTTWLRLQFSVKKHD